MRFCRCGQIYRTECPKCGKNAQHRTTCERGYDWEHRKASEAYRREHPLCEACVKEGVLQARPSKALHHIRKIIDAPLLRMKRSNWLALCDPCHVRLEDEPEQALQVKRWSQQYYRETLTAGV